ncbi:MAG: TetR/AcrR family transcriptional regulator [Clostridia bacterium]|nr:TetR/AcrR family transcriptional regulator [Clostridia bacterium]
MQEKVTKKGGDVRSKVLHAAARLFLEKGYADSTVREIARNAEVNLGSLVFAFKNKENILCELVGYVLESQFKATAELLGDRAQDRVLFYAAETTLQLYMAESSEHMREMYNVSYSLPNSATIIHRTITGKLQEIFGVYHPEWQTRDFYEREISTAGIMRSHISVPCDMYFTMDRKVRVFLETTFAVLGVPSAKIEEAVAFVTGFDWKRVAQDVLANMLTYLENRM